MCMCMRIYLYLSGFQTSFEVRTVCSLKNRDLQRALFYVFNICQHCKCLHTNPLKDKKLFMH